MNDNLKYFNNISYFIGGLTYRLKEKSLRGFELKTTLFTVHRRKYASL